MNRSIQFETERLKIRQLTETDREGFYDMMSNPNVMSPIPREILDRESSDKMFDRHRHLDFNSDTKVWAIETKHNHEFVGIAAYLKNSKQEDEIGYRLREQAWGIGFGTEIAKGLLEHGFNHLKLELITADVNVQNERSLKILDKFMQRDFEFFNPADNCTDRRYKISRVEWMK